MAALKSMRIVVLALWAVAAPGSLAAGERIEPASFQPGVEFPARAVTVRDDRGGQVILYGLRMLKWREKGIQVRFDGQCQSACTLYLGLSQEQTCIGRGATFSFHSPYDAGGRESKIAQDYMMRNYPEWVKLWIESKGGLSRRMKTMPYGYASIFLKPCGRGVAEGASGITRLLASGKLFDD